MTYEMFEQPELFGREQNFFPLLYYVALGLSEESRTPMTLIRYWLPAQAHRRVR